MPILSSFHPLIFQVFPKLYSVDLNKSSVLKLCVFRSINSLGFYTCDVITGHQLWQMSSTEFCDYIYSTMSLIYIKLRHECA